MLLLRLSDGSKLIAKRCGLAEPSPQTFATFVKKGFLSSVGEFFCPPPERLYSRLGGKV
jgi:hypothetical protein